MTKSTKSAGNGGEVVGAQAEAPGTVREAKLVCQLSLKVAVGWNARSQGKGSVWRLTEHLFTSNSGDLDLDLLGHTLNGPGRFRHFRN